MVTYTHNFDQRNPFNLNETITMNLFFKKNRERNFIWFLLNVINMVRKYNHNGNEECSEYGLNRAGTMAPCHFIKLNLYTCIEKKNDRNKTRLKYMCIFSIQIQRNAFYGRFQLYMFWKWKLNTWFTFNRLIMMVLIVSNLQTVFVCLCCKWNIFFFFGIVEHKSSDVYRSFVNFNYYYRYSLVIVYLCIIWW